MVINGGPGEMVVKLARSFDNFGEEDDIKLFNKVECWCFDRDQMDGLLIYSGYISGYRPVLSGGAEYIEVTLLHYISEMSQIMLRTSNGTTEIAQNSLDPSTIAKNIIDYYQADDGQVSYTPTSVDDTNTTVSYTFNTYTTKEALDKVIELTPQNWYWFVNASNTFSLKLSNVNSATHSFVLGRHISDMETWRRGEDIVNRIYFIGAEDAGVNMYRVYSNTSSITSYGIHAVKYVDQRVSIAATADIMASRVMNKKKDPEIRTTIKIVDNNGENSDKGYDIESVFPGDTMRIKNIKQGVKTISLWDSFVWDEDVWDQTLAYAAADVIQIVSVEYHPNYIVCEASSRTPDISKRIEDVQRNWEGTSTINAPATPTEG